MNVTELQELALFAKIAPIPTQKSALLQALVMAGAMTSQEAEYQGATVKKLREMASARGISPIPGSKKELIAVLMKPPAGSKKKIHIAAGRQKAPAQRETKTVVSKKAAATKAMKPTNVTKIPCGGKGVDTDFLHKELQSLGYLDEYMRGGGNLELPQLRAICKQHNTGQIVPPERTLPPLTEEANGEYALKIKSRDPDLYETVKAIVSHVPDPRNLLGRGTPDQVIWDPWNALYTELGDLFEQGDRFVPVLDYMQSDNTKDPDLNTLTEFIEFFPVLSYIYAWESVYFRWLLVRHNTMTPFRLSEFVEIPEAKIPALLRPCKDSYSVERPWGKIIPLEHDNCRDLGSLLHSLHDLSLFKQNLPEELLKSIMPRLNKSTNLFDIYADAIWYRIRHKEALGDALGDWYEILVYLLENSQDLPHYSSYFGSLAGVSSRLREGRESPAYYIAKKLFDELPADGKPPEALIYFGEYVGNEYEIDAYIHKLIKKFLSFTLFQEIIHILDVALYSGQEQLFQEILPRIPETFVPKVVYENLLKEPYYAYLTDGQRDPRKLLAAAVKSHYVVSDLDKVFKDYIEQRDPHKLLAASVKSHYFVSDLEKVFKDYIDPEKPPDYILDAFYIWGADIKKLMRTSQRWSGPPGGWPVEARIALIKLLVKYGASTDRESLLFLRSTLAEPEMAPLVEWLKQRGADVPE